MTVRVRCLRKAEPLELACINEGERGDSRPGFWGSRIVFLSDEDGCGNIWSCEVDGSDRKRHSQQEECYARWPAVDGARVAYQHAGDLRLLDLETGNDELLQVDLAADVPTTRRRFVDASRFLEHAEPNAERLHGETTEI